MEKSNMRHTYHPQTREAYALVRRGFISIDDSTVLVGVWVSKDGNFLASLGPDNRVIEIRQDEADEMLDGPLPPDSLFRLRAVDNIDLPFVSMDVMKLVTDLTVLFSKHFGQTLVITGNSDTACFVVEHEFKDGLPQRLTTISVSHTLDDLAAFPATRAVEILWPELHRHFDEPGPS